MADGANKYTLTDEIAVLNLAIKALKKGGKRNDRRSKAEAD